MGREAICTCDWAGEVTEVKALLETSEIILRGGIRKRIPFTEYFAMREASGTVGGEGTPEQLGEY